MLGWVELPYDQFGKITLVTLLIPHLTLALASLITLINFLNLKFSFHLTISWSRFYSQVYSFVFQVNPCRNTRRYKFDILYWTSKRGFEPSFFYIQIVNLIFFFFESYIALFRYLGTALNRYAQCVVYMAERKLTLHSAGLWWFYYVFQVF